jgi:uncharacterized protein (TIGR02996 family)
MDYEHSFVQAVRENPADETARLIFADYLEDLGDPRCELIRLQVQIARLPPGDPARRDLDLRETDLLERYADEWTAPLQALGVEGLSSRCFQRGLIERVRISGDAFLNHGAEICRQSPALYCLELRKAGPALFSLAALPLPPQITALDLRSNRLDIREIHHLASARWLPQITSLSLALNELTDSGLSALASAHWPALTHLNLSVNRIQRAGVEALGRRGTTPALTTLLLNANPIGDEGLVTLARSPLAANLRELDVGSCGLTSTGVRGLAGTPLLANLESLVLRGNGLGTEAHEALPVFLRAPRLKRLDLRGAIPSIAQYGYGSQKIAIPETLQAQLGDGLLW